MAHPHLKAPMAEFRAVIHRTKNRLIAIPADVQKRLGLARRIDNHLILVSIRPHGGGRWNHHYFKLTYDNEFALPTDVSHLRAGNPVDIRVHRVIPDMSAAVSAPTVSGAGMLAALAARPREGWRTDGSERLDEYLRETP